MPLIRVDQFDNKTQADIVTLSINDNSWELDLSVESERQLLRDLDRYISAGRRVTGRSRKSSPKKSPMNSVKPAGKSTDLEAVREWARRSPKFAGRKIADRGRIPRDIIDAFAEDHAPNSVQPAFSGT